MAIPLSRFLKNYFSQNKKHGSNDRKIISELCFSFFRLGLSLDNIEFNERIKIALFLSQSNPSYFSNLFDTQYIKEWHADIESRISFIQKKYPYFSLEQIFPLIENAGEINTDEFLKNHFSQQNTFIRIRNNQIKKVSETLHKNSIYFEEISKTCLSFSNSPKLENFLEIDKEIVIQDFSSQKISEFFEFVKSNLSGPINVWDCCAASGGKSILAFDSLNKINLTISDIRPSILENLKHRFDKAGINNYFSFVSDLSKEILLEKKFDLIICDVPCSGSGTWSRTPESLSFFNREKLNQYVELQKKIVGNVLEKLHQKGFFLYVTCSIYREENENVIEHLIKEYNLKLVKSSYLTGYQIKADTMFAAILTF